MEKKLWLVVLVLVSIAMAVAYSAVAEILFFSFEKGEAIPSSLRTLVCILLLLSGLATMFISYFAVYEMGKIKKNKDEETSEPIKATPKKSKQATEVSVPQKNTGENAK